ncbi:MAG: DUF2304 family protein [Flavisolibacter sp.]
MTGIQIILLTGISLISLYFFIRWKKRVFDILILSAMIICAVVFVIWPDITQTLAQKMGVGRGADLVFYISILIFWFLILKLYARTRKLEQMITQFIRKEAIDKNKPSNS